MRFAAVVVLFLVGSAPAGAQPVIESIRGDATPGRTLVLRGVGFGNRPPTPLAFDDFEAGASGEAIREPWTGWSEVEGQAPRHDSGITRRNSRRSLLCDLTGENTESSFGLEVVSDELFVSFHKQLRHTGSFTWSYGQIRVLGGSDNENPQWAHVFLNGHTADGQWIAGASDDGCTLDAAAYGGLGDDVVRVRRWIRHDYWLRASSPNEMDGRMEVWRDLRPDRFTVFSAEKGGLVPVGPPFASRCSDDGWVALRIGHTWAHDPGGDAAIFYDDVYVDVTPARVELGNAPTWEATSVAEIQPSVSWTDDEIEVRVAGGEFLLGSSYWLFVLDSENVPSEGFPVQLGAPYEDPVDAGPPDAGEPPGTVRSGCGCRGIPGPPGAGVWFFLVACLPWLFRAGSRP